MARKTSKSDNYETITNAFIESLQEVVDGKSDRLPWQRAWRTLGAVRNGISNRCYSGMNVMLLAMQGHDDPRWGTSNQIMQAAGFERNTDRTVRRKWNWAGEGEAPTERILTGESTVVTFWKFLDRKVTEKGAQGNEVEVERRIPLLRLFRVYNFSQVNWPAGKEPKALTDTTLDENPAEVYADAEAMFEAYTAAEGLTVTHGGDRAYYNITDDSIQLPDLDAFKTAKGYVATKAHELVHSTGAKGRRDRNLKNLFGTEDYAREELVAEIGSAFLCCDLGVDNEGKLDDNHRAYLLNWIKRLQDNKYEVFTAARLAREAVTFLKSRAAGEEEAVA
jgi:antirestriction protein ArdC